MSVTDFSPSFFLHRALAILMKVLSMLVLSDNTNIESTFVWQPRLFQLGEGAYDVSVVTLLVSTSNRHHRMTKEAPKSGSEVMEKRRPMEEERSLDNQTSSTSDSNV